MDIPNRQTGSPGNRLATDFFAGQMASYGFAVETPGFDCLEWQEEGAELTAGGASFNALPTPSPYSLGCDVQAPLVLLSVALHALLERLS